MDDKKQKYAYWLRQSLVTKEYNKVNEIIEVFELCLKNPNFLLTS